MSFAKLVGAQKERVAMFEAVSKVGVETPPANEGSQVTADEMLLEAIEQAAVTNYRANGMAAVLTWFNDGEPTSENFDVTAIGMADVNEDGEVSDEEEEDYNEILFAMTQALDYMKVDAEAIDGLLEGDDDAADTVFNAIGDYIEDTNDSEEEIIATFSVAKESMTEARKKVIRDGKVKWIKKPLRKRRLSAKQRAALKKARMKANTGAAKAKRKKAMKKRKAAGM